MILKTYSNVLNHGFIDQQISISIAENWICICKIILESQITEDLDTNNFQNNLTNTKCKKVCLKIAYKYFYSYFDPQNMQTIGNYFLNKWFLIFLNVTIELLNKKDSFTVLQLKFINLGFQSKISSNAIKNILPELLIIIFEKIKKTKADEAQWNINPNEFIRNEYYEYESTRCFALKLLTTISEESYLNIVTDFIANGLKSKDFVYKEALMHGLGWISELLIDENYCIEELLFQYCKDELNSTILLLKYRACWVYSKFSNIEYKINNHEDYIFKNILKKLSDSQYLIRLQSAIMLPKMIKNRVFDSFEIKDIENLINVYLELLAQNNIEFASEALDEIIDVFSETISKSPCNLILKLSDNLRTLGMKNDTSDSIFGIIYKLLELNDNEHNFIEISFCIKSLLQFSITQHFWHSIQLLKALIYYDSKSQLSDMINFIYLIKSHSLSDLDTDSTIEVNLKDISSVFEQFIIKYQNSALENIQLFIDYGHSLLLTQGTYKALGLQIFRMIIQNIDIYEKKIINNILSCLTNSVINLTNQKFKKEFADFVILCFCRIPFSMLEFLETNSNIYLFIELVLARNS